MNNTNNTNFTNITFDEGYDQFIKYCKVRNLREGTITHYDNTMYSIYKFIEPKMLIKDITPSTIDSFILYMQNELNIKDVTINTYLRTLKTILYYFMRLGYMEQFKIPLYKFDTQIVETYTDAELEILLKKPNISKCTFATFRSWAICNFLLGTGCRVGTLINIKNKDIDFANEVVYFNVTKNRKPLIIPLSTTLITVLKQYMKVRGGDLEDYLFCTEYGKQADRQTINLSVRTYNRKRGVMKIGLHKFRHTFAKKYILNGGDAFRLQKILGHSDIRVVKMYVNMFTDDLQKDFNNISPLEQLQAQTNKKLKMNRR